MNYGTTLLAAITLIFGTSGSSAGDFFPITVSTTVSKSISLKDEGNSVYLYEGAGSGTMAVLRICNIKQGDKDENAHLFSQMSNEAHAAQNKNLGSDNCMVVTGLRIYAKDANVKSKAFPVLAVELLGIIPRIVEPTIR